MSSVISDLRHDERDPIAVINQTLARQVCPSDNLIGRRFVLNLVKEKPTRCGSGPGDDRVVRACSWRHAR